MRLEHLSVVLRQRDPWEAMDLGIALWRRHFHALMRPWLALTLPVLLLLAALGWALDAFLLASLLLWWLKPWFDRVPLYVLSRAVFGTVPGVRAVLRARELYAPGVLAWLSWRRLHPARALLLPVDLLEGARGARRGLRVAVLQRAVAAQAFGLLLVALGFQLAAMASTLLLVLMFVPTEFLSESARAMMATLFEAPPAWAQLLLLCVHWLAMSAIEPLYVAAGFGLYLHRRTQLEAWDVELAFRRLAARARAASAGLLLALALLGAGLLVPAPALAGSEVPVVTPAQLLGEAARPPDPAFQRAVERAYADPSLARTRTVTHWQLRHEFDTDDSSNPELPAWLKWIGQALAALAEYGLWLLAGLLLALLLWQLPRWLPWVRRQLRVEAPLPEVVEQPLPEPLPLPDDVPAAVAALWQQARAREALALLYRAGVARLAAQLGTAFPPGTTEGEWLRRARNLPDAEARASFNAVVRTWQRAAYAHRYPDGEAFNELLADWARRFPAVPP